MIVFTPCDSPEIGRVECNIYPTRFGGPLTDEQSAVAFRVAESMVYHPKLRPNAGICMPHHYPGWIQVSAHALDKIIKAWIEAGVPVSREVRVLG